MLILAPNKISPWIAKEDLPLALERHATSKIETATDLFEVLTLGFRGEALASLAAIAKVTVTSRPEGEETAWQVSDADREPSPVRGNPGTVVEAHDLFHSVPARRRFLKTERTEAGYAMETVRRTAMACPGIEFELRHNDRRMLRIQTGAERVQDLFSKAIAESAIPIERDGEHMHLTGWIGTGRQEEHILVVNGRTVRKPGQCPGAATRPRTEADPASRKGLSARPWDGCHEGRVRGSST